MLIVNGWHRHTDIEHTPLSLSRSTTFSYHSLDSIHCIVILNRYSWRIIVALIISPYTNLPVFDLDLVTSRVIFNSDCDRIMFSTFLSNL